VETGARRRAGSRLGSDEPAIARAGRQGLVELSDRVGELRALRTLDLGHNQVRQIPAALGELVGLSGFLYLHDNALKELPPPFGASYSVALP
jgi:Leucine-rich repeat (LRR) protein